MCDAESKLIGTNRPPYVTVTEMAQRLNRSVYTINDYCRKGYLPAFKNGHQWRVNRKYFEKLMKKIEAAEISFPPTS